MGCDIHFFVEKYTDQDFNGPKDVSVERQIKLESVLEDQKTFRWVSADNWIIEDGSWTIPYDDYFYSGRNYYLFALLANVRNYYDPISHIDDPRGVPNDASDGYKYMVQSWGSDGHSHTYFTLDELLNIDWSSYDQEWVAEFQSTLDKMKKIDSDYKKVRAVFFFDN